MASAVLRRLTDAAGVRIGHLSDIAPAIFHVCNASGWDSLQNKFLVIDLEEGTCVTANDAMFPAGDLVVVCAFAPLIKALRFDLLNANAPLPKTPVESQSNDIRIRKRAQR